MPDWDLAQLRALASVADLGSFDAAARALHVTPSAVSQRIKALERGAGSILVHRERPVRVTAAGEPLVRLARQVAALVADTDRAMEPSGPPRVPLAVNGDSLTTWALPALRDVAADVALELYREDQDRSADLLRSGEVMAAITAESAPVQGCTSERLGTMRYWPVAAPGFVAHWFADGPDAPSLTRAPLVTFDDADRLQDRYLDRVGATPGETVRHRVPASADFAMALVLGFGWGMLPEQQSADLESAGALVRLENASPVDVALHWQQWSLHTASLDRVANAVRAGAARDLRP